MLRVLFNFIMGIGIFAKTFIRPTLEQVLDCVYEQGIKNIQFNMSCAGLAPLPDFIDPVTSKRIFHETERRDIKISAVSGTFNMIHPNKLEREIGLARLNTLATASKEMGASVITLCTGTRDPDNMWRKHPGNREGSAWKDLLACMETALGIAENHNVMLAFEPEQANVVDSAEKGKRLLNEMKSNSDQTDRLVRATTKVADAALKQADRADGNFYQGKLQACRYFFRWELPKVGPMLDLLESIDTTTLDMQDAWF